jgi:NADP-dependent 3-hydroxy acid dehydrogenase YdfG
VAVVTGAGSGIGRAIALALSARGAQVWLVGRTARALADVADEAHRTAAPAVPCVVDLADDQAVRQLAERLRSEAGSVDVLVHSAGVIEIGPVAAASVEDLDRQYRVNLRGPYVLTQALLPLLREGGGGHVVFVNSSVWQAAGANVAQYAATKFGLKAFADSLRAEVNADGVRVLTVYPGRTATPMGRAVHAAEGKPYRPDTLAQPEDVAAMVLAAIELPATAEVTDLSVRPARKP